MHALREINFDILGLSEVRRLGEVITEKENGDIFSYMGETKGQKGVGFIIKKHLKDKITKIYGVSERITVLALTICKKKMSIIQVYAPTEASTEEESDKFYNLLDDTINDIKTDSIIVMGDFNSKIGHKESAEEETMGPYGYGSRNERGEKLIHFAQGHKLKIINTFFKKPEGSRWTWQAPNGKIKNEIDFIMTDRIKDICNIQVVNGLKFDTDHRMIRVKMSVKKGKRHYFKQRATEPERLDKMKYLTTLKDNVQKMNEQRKEEMQCTYTNLEKCITQAAKSAKILDPKERRINKLTEDTRNLIERRERLRAQSEINPQLKEAFTELNKHTKREIRRDIRSFKHKQIQETIENYKSVKRARKQLSEGKHWILGVQDNEGRRQTARDEILAQATTFYSKLYTSTLPQSDQTHDPNSTIGNNEEVPHILTCEVRTALKELKNNKCPGDDGIYNEYIKLGQEVLIPVLTQLFNEIITTEVIPREWETSTIILLHKKGTRDNINNYRPISLSSNLYKLFMKIITRRLTKILDSNQPTEQAGFRTGFSTTDHLQTVNQLIEKSQEFNHTLFIAFLDFNKAFDSVEHAIVLQALLHQGVPIKYIRILGNMYNNCRAKVRTEKEGKEFKIKRGVKQGDPLSPKLFTSLLEHQFRKIEWKNEYGINIDGHKLTHLRFADDIVVFATSAQILKEMMNDIDTVSREAGLTLNTTKTKVMTNTIEDPIQLNQVPLEYVQQYIYLGQNISPNSNTEKEISRRIGLAWRKFWSLKFILMDKKQKTSIKAETLEKCVIPTLLYGCQTWSLTEKQKRTLQICQRRMERKILHITYRDRIRNDIIRSRTRMTDVATAAASRKWKWGGHVARMDHQRWTHKVTMWDPRIGWRNVGRQKTRWADHFKSIAGGQWSRVARNRERWKQLGRLEMTHNNRVSMNNS